MGGGGKESAIIWCANFVMNFVIMMAGNVFGEIKVLITGAETVLHDHPSRSISPSKRC